MFLSLWTSLLLAASCIQSASAGTVMAHFMVANSYAYKVPEWKVDMKAAQQMNIDGFALNWASPDCSSPNLDWMVDRIDDAYTAAASVGFKLMLSFDMSYIVCDTYWNTTFMASMISRNAASTATLRWNTNIVVSTFGGDVVSQYGDSFFQELKDTMAAQHNTISLVPALTTYSSYAQTDPSGQASALIKDYPSIDGYLNWQAWPLDTHTNLTTEVDAAFKSALTKAGRTGPYIMAISPWQYKDLNNGNTEDSWVQYSDTLFAQRLASVATAEFTPDIIELLTWNDFGESHYLRDVPSTIISAPAYVTYANGMFGYVEGQNHAPWRIIAKYYLKWWKTGKAPTIIADQVVYWYRVHPKGVTCSGGSTVPIRNADVVVDAVFAWALVKSSANITITAGSNTRTFSANGTGPQLSMVPFPSMAAGGSFTPTAKIVRNGKTIVTAKGSKPVTQNCAWQNYNPVVNLGGVGINR